MLQNIKIQNHQVKCKPRTGQTEKRIFEEHLRKQFKSPRMFFKTLEKRKILKCQTESEIQWL